MTPIASLLAISCLLMLLALVVAAHVRQGWRYDATLHRLEVALRQLDAASAAAIRWRRAHEQLSTQLAADVDEAIAQALAVTEARVLPSVLPAPADLYQVEDSLFTEIINCMRGNRGV